MGPAMTCPDCSAGIDDSTDLRVGRRVHTIGVRGDGSVEVDTERTVTVWHCADCDLVVGFS